MNPLDIILKNNQLLVVNKPPGLSVQPDKSTDTSLLQQAEAYCHHPLHLVNRLDRPVSGLVVFAKSPSAMTAMTQQFRERTVDKEYLAVVQEMPQPDAGAVTHWLQHQQGNNRAQVWKEPHPGAELAELEYRMLASSDRYHLLLVRLLTGRHHQVRAQLAALGFPVKGDVKYGFKRGNRDRSIHLHAWKLAFDHPVSGERLHLQASPPQADPVWTAFITQLPGF